MPPDPGTTRLVKGDRVIDAPVADIGKYWAEGFRPENDEAQDARESTDRLDARVGGTANAVRAGVLGALRGATLGGSDVAFTALGGDDQARYESALRDAHPYVSAAGQIAGMLAPTLLSGGATVEAGGPLPGARLLESTPSGFVSRIGAKIAAAGDESALGKFGATAAAGAFEGAAQNAGSYVSDVALGDRDLSAEGFLGAMGKGALYGGVAAGALSVAHNGLIAARKLIPAAEATPEAVAAAEGSARGAIRDSVDTSTQLEAAGRGEAARSDVEAQQLVKDLDAERAAAQQRAQAAQAQASEQATTAEATRARIRSEIAAGRNPDELGPFTDQGLDLATEREIARRAQPRDPRQLMSAWRAKYPEGAVDYDAANAAARRGRLAAWAKDFQPTTDEDAAIKAYFDSPQDPVRTMERVGGGDAPAAVQKVASEAAAKAGREAYLDATTQGANVADSGTELMARSLYASRRAAARALDDVYTAYKAGAPIVDIQAAATRKLTDQLHELAEARADMIKSLAGKPAVADDLMAQLSGTKAGLDQGKSIGEMILQGAPKPVDPDAAVARALGKSKDVNADIADIAPKITRYEAAKAQLTESLGTKAPPDAVAHAQAFREAQQGAEAASTKTTAQAAETIDRATRGASADKLAGGRPLFGGLAGKAGNLGATYELLRQMGVPLPDPHSIPVIGPLLSLYLKAKIASKVLGKFGGSFAATAEGTIAAKAAATQNRINAAVDAIATGAGRVGAKAADLAAGAPALAHKLFDDGEKAPYTSAPRSAPIEDMYRARLGELVAAQKPGAVEQAIRARINTSDPRIIDALVAAETRRLAYLYSVFPKPVMPMPGQPQRLPSKGEIDEAGIVLAAFHDPAAIFERVGAGGVARDSEVRCVQNCYPTLYATAQKKLVEKLVDSKAAVPYNRRIAGSMLTGIPMDETMLPDHDAYLQSAAPKLAAAAPMPHPTLTGSVNLGQQTLTRLDR